MIVDIQFSIQFNFQKEKYEKLRAVSTDQWERSSAEESDANTAVAEKQYKNRLVSRCWKAWKEAARSKDFSDDVANEVSELHIIFGIPE